MEKEKIRYEPLPKPELEDIKEVIPNTEDFDEPEKAAALCKALNLEMGDNIQDVDGEQYTINPRYVLEGHSPDYYKETMENLKKLLTDKEIKAITAAMKRRTKDYDKELYDELDKKTNKFYWRHNIRKSLPDEIKDLLEFFKSDEHTGLSNTIYHLLSKGDDSFLICYRCAWFNKPIPDQREWHERNDGEYRVLTDSEADQAFDDYFEDDYLWKEAVESGNTTLGQDEWIDHVKDCDGRGHILNGYDGEELEEDDYFIYRTN